MNAHSKWNVKTPMTAQLNQEIIDYMVAYVSETIGVVEVQKFDESLNPVHLLVKEKEFKYGKGKEYIAFTDGGKNQFGKDVKYVKFFYYYDSNGKMKPNDKTYTFGLEKARTFWNEKVKEGYTVYKNPDSTQVEEKQAVTSNSNENNNLGENNE